MISLPSLRCNTLWDNNTRYDMELVAINVVLSCGTRLTGWLIDEPVGSFREEDTAPSTDWVTDTNLRSLLCQDLRVGDTSSSNSVVADTSFSFLCPPRRDAKLQLTYISAFSASLTIIVSASCWSRRNSLNNQNFFSTSKVSNVRIDKFLPIDNQLRVMRCGSICNYV